MSQVEETRRWNSHWCIGHISPCPNQSRWLQMDTRRSSHVVEKPYYMTRTSISTVRTKTCLHPACSPCWTWTAILVSAPRWRWHLFITRAYTCDNRFVWGDVYFLVLGKLKVWNSPCQESKKFFLVCIVPQKRFLRFGGILVYLFSLWSNLWYYSPYIYPKQCPLVYLIGDDSEWIGWRRFQHSYQMWKQLWMEEHEQQLLHQRSYSHRMEVDSAVLYWQA